ncbi:hypothetical protein I5T93_01630 [Stenotrophomonas maltophilia]|nr:hypothetical protein [Stenotrophomonas maltophilia]
METKLNPDRALQPGSAIASDKLGRRPFAEAAIRALRGVSRADGYVLAVEGQWGTGKSSALSMIQDLLAAEKDHPTIVNFNPWLIGNRDTLLKAFFDAIYQSLDISDKSKEAQKTAKLIKNYSKALTAIKLVPGITAIASAIQEVVSAVADSAEAIAKEHESNLEQQRSALTNHLCQLDSRIVVFIDDVDRLIPSEVIELIRIVKAIGGLPNLGYVVAWDREYVEKSIASADIPNSSSYLDKIVQIRLPLPVILEGKRQALLQSALDDLPLLAHKSYFPHADDRLSGVYYHGLRELLRHPRDIARTMNWLAIIEPTLRGEIVLADLIALSCIMTKAPSIYSEMHNNPLLFQGRISNNTLISNKDDREKIIKEKVNHIFSECDMPDAVQTLVFYLFPELSAACGKGYYSATSSNLGLISEPGRLALALNFNVDEGDVSLAKARSFIYHPEQRNIITKELTPNNVVDFIDAVGRIASQAKNLNELHVPQLCTDLASIVDNGTVVDRLSKRDSYAYSDPESTAVESIERITTNLNTEKEKFDCYEALLEDEMCLSTRAEIVRRIHSKSRPSADAITTFPAAATARAAPRLVADAVKAAKTRILWQLCNPSRIIWACMRYAASSQCRRLFKAIEKKGDLDNFVLAALKHSYSSNSGQSYAVPEDRDLFEKFAQISEMKRLAKRRLRDSTMEFPLKAAWMAIAEEKVIIGKDGTATDD